MPNLETEFASDETRSVPATLRAEFIPVAYDHQRLGAEMQAERLPEDFMETILTGWWTTCLEVLPANERLPGKF